MYITGTLQLNQGRAGKIWGPEQKSKIGPYLARKFEIFDKYNIYILISYTLIGNIKNHTYSTLGYIMFI
jgi:hypothetical protein